MRRRNLLREGAIGGLIGGVSFAACQSLIAAIAGFEPGTPWEAFASLVLGRSALEGGLAVHEFVIGAVLHFGLAALFGTAFGVLDFGLSHKQRNSFAVQLGLGAAFGLALYLVTFETFGRFLWPWFQDLAGFGQVMAHVLFYGVPVAYWVVLRVRDVEVPGVREERREYQTQDDGPEAGRYARDLPLGRPDLTDENRPTLH